MSKAARSSRLKRRTQPTFIGLESIGPALVLVLVPMLPAPIPREIQPAVIDSKVSQIKLAKDLLIGKISDLRMAQAAPKSVLPFRQSLPQIQFPTIQTTKTSVVPSKAIVQAKTIAPVIGTATQASPNSQTDRSGGQMTPAVASKGSSAPSTPASPGASDAPPMFGAATDTISAPSGMVGQIQPGPRLVSPQVSSQQNLQQAGVVGDGLNFARSDTSPYYADVMQNYRFNSTPYLM